MKLSHSLYESDVSSRLQEPRPQGVANNNLISVQSALFVNKNRNTGISYTRVRPPQIE